MIIHLLSIPFALFLGNTQPTNYYTNYTSARDASKDAQKEMVVFFTSKSCSTCESAWSAFAKDAAYTQQYVSTRMDAEDFDGGICFELFGLKQVPAWVILTPGSNVKEKWEGGWKDSSGNPTAFDLSMGQTVVKEEKKSNTTTQNASTTSSTKMSSSSISTSNSFVLQAGYFGSEMNAQKIIGDLKANGYSGFKIEPVQKDGTTFYKVISKIYNSETDVDEEQQRLSTSGIKTSVKKL